MQYVFLSPQKNLTLRFLGGFLTLKPMEKLIQTEVVSFVLVFCVGMQSFQICQYALFASVFVFTELIHDSSVDLDESLAHLQI